MKKMSPFDFLAEVLRGFDYPDNPEELTRFLRLSDLFEVYNLSLLFICSSLLEFKFRQIGNKYSLGIIYILF